MNKTLPPTLREQITSWMTDNPGWRSAVDIIAGVRLNAPFPGVHEQSVRNELTRMVGADLLERERLTPSGKATQKTFFRLLATADLLS